MGKKLLLVNPVDPARAGLAMNLAARYPPLGLGIIAALTPKDWEIEIADENFETFKYKEVDLVGITALTPTVNRAYEIAGIYRDRGITTVLGGIHASMLPDEALQYVNTVVTGEAESVWGKVIADFEAGRIQRVYQGEWSDLKGLPVPMHNLFHPGYEFGSIQTSRGCPMDCEFCSVAAFNGHRYRQRPVEDVLDELETIPQGLVFFVDDNIIGYGKQAEERAIALFKGIIERRIKKFWMSQASLNFSENEEVIEYAAKSGCKMIFIGLEAENTDALKAVNKKLNLKMGVDTYERAFRRINRHGISVLGAFIYGMDSDTPEILHRRTDYILKSRLNILQITPLTPLPGTRLFNKMRDAGRLLYSNFPADWAHFSMETIVHQPITMGLQEYQDLMIKCIHRLYSLRAIWRRTFNTWIGTRSLITTFWAYNGNINYRNVAIKSSSKAKHRNMLLSAFRSLIIKLMS